MKASDVLLCMSLDEQRQAEIHDRLTKRGHLPSMTYVRKTLNKLTADGLVVTRKTELGGCFYRLAEGQAVEDALDAAWSLE
jgi:DNA-binding PadR family transcriptional regulator